MPILRFVPNWRRIREAAQTNRIKSILTFYVAASSKSLTTAFLHVAFHLIPLRFLVEKISLRLCRSLANALATRRLATNLFSGTREFGSLSPNDKIFFCVSLRSRDFARATKIHKKYLEALAFHTNIKNIHLFLDFNLIVTLIFKAPLLAALFYVPFCTAIFKIWTRSSKAVAAYLSTFSEMAA